MAVMHLTQENFDAVIAQGKSLVDFWATWCGPCRMLAPAIEELGAKYEGKVNICKVDVDAQPQLAARFGVMSIPTVIAFDNGKETGKLVGLRPAAELEALLK